MKRLPKVGDIVELEYGYSVYRGRCTAADRDTALIECDRGHLSMPMLKVFITPNPYNNFIIVGHEAGMYKPCDGTVLQKIATEPAAAPPEQLEQADQAEPPTHRRRNWFMRLVFGDRR